MTDLTDPTKLRAQMALLSIFRDLGIPAGDTLSIGEIAGTWPDYGIRSSDLAWALDGLVHEGLLARELGAPEQIVLTTSGERWLRQQPSWLKYRLLVPRASRARYLQRHGAHASKFAHRRRRDDVQTVRDDDDERSDPERRSGRCDFPGN